MAERLLETELFISHTQPKNLKRLLTKAEFLEEIIYLMLEGAYNQNVGYVNLY